VKLEADFEEIPDDAVMEYGISIVVYMTQDGDQKYGFMAQGHLSTVSMIGVLEMAKRTVLGMNDRDT
jgi:hypothetical protein